MNKDFDRAMLEQYYPQYFCTTDLGKIRLQEYQKLLIFGESKMLFLETIFYFPNENIPNNFYFYPYFQKYNNLENEVYKIFF